MSNTEIKRTVEQNTVVVSLDSILRKFADDFAPIDDNREIMSVDYYVDTAKGKVAFVIYSQEKASK